MCQNSTFAKTFQGLCKSELAGPACRSQLQRCSSPDYNASLASPAYDSLQAWPVPRSLHQGLPLQIGWGLRQLINCHWSSTVQHFTGGPAIWRVAMPLSGCTSGQLLTLSCALNVSNPPPHTHAVDLFFALLLPHM